MSWLMIFLLFVLTGGGLATFIILGAVFGFIGRSPDSHSFEHVSHPGKPNVHERSKSGGDGIDIGGKP